MLQVLDLKNTKRDEALMIKFTNVLNINKKSTNPRMPQRLKKRLRHDLISVNMSMNWNGTVSP